MKSRARETQLMVGTRKGAFLFHSDARRHWKLSGPFFDGTEVNHFTYDPRHERHWVALSSWHFGSVLQFSTDSGRKWRKPADGPKFSTKDMAVKRLWCVAVDRPARPGTLWCGADPGALFRTDDGGKTWHEVVSLTTHPTRQQWMPGAGGMCTHSVLVDPQRPRRLYVGISAAGCFRSDDDGATWQPLNKNVRADFLPNKLPLVGQCVHHLAMSPANPDWLFQQNHCGVYGTTDGAGTWHDLSRGLPSRFGFPLIAHPHEQETIYVIPENGAERRYVCNAKLTVYRSRNRGRSWQKLTRGLPQKNCYAQVLRQAGAADTRDEAGLYFGTNTGEIYFSRDAGDSWDLLAAHLPPILSLETAVI